MSGSSNNHKLPAMDSLKKEKTDVNIESIPISDMKISSDKDKEKERARSKTRGQELLSGRKGIIKGNGVTYITERVVGNGSFGVVYLANVENTVEIVAIKKVIQDKRFKNRELQIMKLLNHPNVVKLKNSFYTHGDKPDDVFLNLVLEYVPETLCRVSQQYIKSKTPIPLINVKLYTFQLCRALAYIHSLAICHRDIKPQNLLLDHATGVLKLCDFGSAKILIKGELNVSYICSRYYRAPELIFGSRIYTTSIDVWSMGCVMAELLLGQPLFPGDSSVDQLVKIIKVLGVPTKAQVQAMNPYYTEYRFPPIKGQHWSAMFPEDIYPQAVDLIPKLLQYSPQSRIKPIEALVHPFFDELRDPSTVLPNNQSLPPRLFDFTPSELSNLKDIPLERVVPRHLLKPNPNTTTSTTSQTSTYSTTYVSSNQTESMSTKDFASSQLHEAKSSPHNPSKSS